MFRHISKWLVFVSPVHKLRNGIEECIRGPISSGNEVASLSHVTTGDKKIVSPLDFLFPKKKKKKLPFVKYEIVIAFKWFVMLVDDLRYKIITWFSSVKG